MGGDCRDTGEESGSRRQWLTERCSEIGKETKTHREREREGVPNSRWEGGQGLGLAMAVTLTQWSLGHSWWVHGLMGKIVGATVFRVS